MPRTLMRIALVAGLMLGVVAMHSFGHTSHTEQHGQIVVTMHSAHHGHPIMGTGSAPAEDDSDRSALLSVFGLMACGAIIARFVLVFFHSAIRSRLRYRLLATLERLGRAPAQRWLPPSRLQPTGLQVNRVAVLRT